MTTLLELLQSPLTVLVIAASAFVVDWIASVLLLPNISLMARPTMVFSEERPDEAGSDRAFLLAIQNNEDTPLDFSDEAIILTVSVRSSGRLPIEAPVKVYAAPDDDYEVVVSGDGKSFRLEIPRMRPLKTWMVRCVVLGGEELGVTLEVPVRSLMRKMLQRINRVMFQFRRLEMHRRAIVVRREEVHTATKRSFGHGLANTVFPAFLLSPVLYVVTAWLVIRSTDAPQEVVARLPATPVPMWVDWVVILAGVLLFHVLATTDDVPIAQGYQRDERDEGMNGTPGA